MMIWGEIYVNQNIGMCLAPVIVAIPAQIIGRPPALPMRLRTVPARGGVDRRWDDRLGQDDRSQPA